MLLELLAGIATSLECSVFSLLSKICGRLQTPRNCLKVTQNRKAVPVGSQSCPQIEAYQISMSLSVDSENQKVNQSDVRPDASLVRTDGVLSDHPDLKSSVRPDSDPRSRPSAPCDIKAETDMVLGKINLDIPFNKTSLLWNLSGASMSPDIGINCL